MTFDTNAADQNEWNFHLCIALFFGIALRSSDTMILTQLPLKSWLVSHNSKLSTHGWRKTSHGSDRSGIEYEISSPMQVVGELDLAKKFEEGQTSIRRDIIFCASLYL